VGCAGGQVQLRRRLVEAFPFPERGELAVHSCADWLSNPVRNLPERVGRMRS
jgi:hypothetical protein